MKVPQIFDRNMKRLAFLDNAVSVGYSLEINSLWTATFTLPADDDKNAYCQPLNFVEIFDGDERIDLFRIIGEDLERSNGATRFYDCEHVLATLLSDVLFQYHQYGGGGIKTADVLNYVLARQTTRNWVLGDCDFKRYFEYNWENSTLLAALFAVPECFDSEYMWTWDTTVYPWTISLVALSDTMKSEVRYAKNMTSMKKTVDASGIANRIYALGYGEGVNQLTIAGVNGGKPYVEDAMSIQQYGLCSTILVDSRYEVAENLKGYAEQMLAELKNPYVSYEIGAIDLHRLTGDTFSKFRRHQPPHAHCQRGEKRRAGRPRKRDRDHSQQVKGHCGQHFGTAKPRPHQRNVCAGRDESADLQFHGQRRRNASGDAETVYF